MNNHQSNPHLPRVERIHSIKTPTGAVHVVKMEKLHHIDSLSPDESHAMFSHAFGRERTPQFGYPTALHFADVLSGHLHDHYAGHKNAQFSTAMNDTIKHLADTPRKMNDKTPGLQIRPDIHSGNIMARKTPTGPQLVVTDPFASDSDVSHTIGYNGSPTYKKELRASKKK